MPVDEICEKRETPMNATATQRPNPEHRQRTSSLLLWSKRDLKSGEIGKVHIRIQL